MRSFETRVVTTEQERDDLPDGRAALERGHLVRVRGRAGVRARVRVGVRVWVRVGVRVRVRLGVQG